MTRYSKDAIANLTPWPKELVENFRILLNGGRVSERPFEESFEVVRSRAPLDFLQLLNQFCFGHGLML